MDEIEDERPVSPARLSKTPSWITLGFVLGVLFVLALPERKPAGDAAAPARAVEPEPPAVKLERPTLTEIEAVFADWGEAAVWQNDRTEVALWDRERRSYSLCYQVLRDGEQFYFRSIPTLTRPVLTEGVAENSPLQFTTLGQPQRTTTPPGVRALINRPKPDRPPEKLPLQLTDPGQAAKK